jgi:hypothetical protein
MSNYFICVYICSLQNSKLNIINKTAFKLALDLDYNFDHQMLLSRSY